MPSVGSGGSLIRQEAYGWLGVWERFWFKRADPTTLGLMRIFVGMLIVYVHIIYSFDLHDLFGKDGWYSLDVINKRRHESPWIYPVDTWQTGEEPSNYKPYDYEPANMPFVFKGDNEDRRLELLRVVPVMPWKSDQERERIEQMTSDAQIEMRMLSEPDDLPEKRRRELATVKQKEAQLALLDLHYWLFVDEYSLDPRSLLKKNGEPLPEQERAAILDYSKTFGVDPRKVDAKGIATFSIWYHVTDPDWMVVVHVGIILVMILFTFGVCTRITSVLTWLAAVSYIHRAPTVLFGQDTMMNILLIYLMVGPSGAALSIDRLVARWRARRLGLEFPDKPVPSVIANVAYRLVQIHLCMIYLYAGASKMQGATWWNGTAVWWTMANHEFAPLNREIYRNFLKFLAQHRWLWEIVMTGGCIHTLFVELTFTFLVWHRKLRWFMITVATLLHAGIALLMGLTLFQLFMLVFLLAFYPPETMQRLVQSIREAIGMALPGRARPAAQPAPVATGA